MQSALAASSRHCCRCTPQLFQFSLSSSYPRHSYFSTGVAGSGLLCISGAICQSGCRFCETCADATVSTANEAMVWAWETPLPRQALDTLSKPRQICGGSTSKDMRATRKNWLPAYEMRMYPEVLIVAGQQEPRWAYGVWPASERARNTLEVIGLIMSAPLLYSMSRLLNCHSFRETAGGNSDSQSSSPRSR